MNPKYLLVAAAALSLGACTKDDTHTETVTENRGHKISFTIAEDSETRTTLSAGDVMTWMSTDEVGIYTVGQNKNLNTLTTADVNQNPVEFVGALNQTVSPGDKFYAYYPYNEAQSTDPTKVQLTIPAKQTQTEAGVYDGQSHPLVAVPMDFKWDQGSDACRINDVRFRLLGAIVELQIFSSDETLHSKNEKIQSVTFVSQDPLTGDFTFDLTGVTVDKEPQIKGYELKEVKTFLDEPAAIPAEDDKALVYLTIAPGTYAGQFVVTTDAMQYTFNLKNPMNFKRAVIKGLPADLAEATREMNPDAPIRFADSEVKWICVENWDTNKDSELSYQEAAAVKSIGTLFGGQSIGSFNELQYFTGLESIGNYAFAYCIGLTSITIPDGVTAIGDYAFANCINLTSIHLPEGVTVIGDHAFYGCAGLESITIPEGVTAIGNYTFADCSSLESITIPTSVTKIGERAFKGCEKLTSITIPNEVTEIKENTFGGCGKLESIQLPNGLTKIEDYAFMGCSSLTNIQLPNEVTAIGNSAFLDCNNLTSIHLPNGVTSIGSSAFRNCGRLTSITIPDGVTSIDDSAFRDCGRLTSITIPDKVTEIGSDAFNGCSNLKSIQLPKELKTIETYAFAGCSSLESITIPDKVTTIGQYCFRDCSNLESVYCEPTYPPTLALYAFNFMSPSLRIHVPAASFDAYRTAADKGWSTYAGRIVGDIN